MSRRIDSDLLLVGSLPVENTEEAFRYGTEYFGDLTFALPDGETGARQGWVSYERERLARPTAGVAVVEETQSPTGLPRHAFETPIFGLEDGVTEIEFGSWPRIDDAIESYEVFRKLKDEGVVDKGMRFQIGLPFPLSALNAFKADFAHDYPIVERAFEELVGREIDRLLETIPATELAIQWDCAYETQDIEGVVSWFPKDGAWERFTGPVSRLTANIPEDVLVGYHLCYGTFPEWPMYEPQGMDIVVKMANHALANSGRRIDWLHLAGSRYFRSEDERFYKPLEDLELGDARLFLGIILPLDGEAGAKRRHATASQYVDDFGVAMYCGFGRQRGFDGIETMQEHRDTVKAIA